MTRWYTRHAFEWFVELFFEKSSKKVFSIQNTYYFSLNFGRTLMQSFSYLPQMGVLSVLGQIKVILSLKIISSVIISERSLTMRLWGDVWLGSKCSPLLITDSYWLLLTASLRWNFLLGIHCLNHRQIFLQIIAHLSLTDECKHDTKMCFMS